MLTPSNLKDAARKAEQKQAEHLAGEGSQQANGEGQVVRTYVQGCFQDADGIEAVSDDKDPRIQFWTVYAVMKDGLSYAVQDFPTKDEAVANQGRMFKRAKTGMGFGEPGDVLQKLSACGDAMEVRRFCETLVDIAGKMIHAKAQGRIQAEDSRELVQSIIDSAVEFEAKHAKTDWDASPVDYIEAVDAFTEAQLKDMDAVSLDQARTELFRRNLKVVGLSSPRPPLEEFAWQRDMPTLRDEPLHKAHMSAEAVQPIMAAILATYQGEDSSLIVGPRMGREEMEKLALEWGTEFARGKYSDRALARPWVAEYVHMQGSDPAMVSRREAFVKACTGAGLPLPGIELPPEAKYRMVLRSVGNPDMAQYFGENVLSPTTLVLGSSMEDLQRRAGAYRDEHGLGSGNWPELNVVKEAGIPVASISYNGRAWLKNTLTPTPYKPDVIQRAREGIKPATTPEVAQSSAPTRGRKR